MSHPAIDDTDDADSIDDPTDDATRGEPPAAAGPRTARAAVIDAIAETEGVDALELEFSLQSTVDVDVLDGLAAQPNADWRLEFVAGNHDVVVGGDGTVVVDGDEFPDAFER